MNRIRKATLALAAAVLAAVTMTACGGPSRPCLRGHDETILVPIYTGGRYGSTTIIPETDFVCDEYAPDPTSTPTR